MPGSDTHATSSSVVNQAAHWLGVGEKGCTRSPNRLPPILVGTQSTLGQSSSSDDKQDQASNQNSTSRIVISSLPGHSDSDRMYHSGTVVRNQFTTLDSVLPDRAVEILSKRRMDRSPVRTDADRQTFVRSETAAGRLQVSPLPPVSSSNPDRIADVAESANSHFAHPSLQRHQQPIIAAINDRKNSSDSVEHNIRNSKLSITASVPSVRTRHAPKVSIINKLILSLSSSL